MEGGTNFDNAYNSSREPISGFNMNRIQGVEHFKRDEHFLYLKQHDKDDLNRKVKLSNFKSDSDPFSKVRKYIQEKKDFKAISRGRTTTKLAFIGVSAVFCIAFSIGLYW